MEEWFAADLVPGDVVYLPAAEGALKAWPVDAVRISGPAFKREVAIVSGRWTMFVPAGQVMTVRRAS